MKVCSRCKRNLPLQEFYADKRTRDGLYSSCRNCQSFYRNRWWKSIEPARRKVYGRWSENRDNYNKWRNKRKDNDPKFHLDSNIASAISSSLRGRKGWRKWEELVGYSAEDLMRHLETSFNNGMTWDNYGKWHVDHIIPKNSFNYTSPEDKEFKECWELKNLQPLWAGDNLRKSSKN